MTQTTQEPPASSLLHEMWRTRPYRFPAEGKIAGVSTGIGRRYGIDPLLVRVAFVVGTFFGGAGIPVYLACWLLLPRFGEAASAAEALLGRGHSSEPRVRTIILVVALGISGSSLLSGSIWRGLSGSGLVGAVLLISAVVLLHRRSPNGPPMPPQVPVVDLSKAEAPSTGEPPSWDPLGAAPFAWGLPEPSPQTEPKPPRSRHTPVTLGIAVLVVGAAVAVRLLTDAAWLSANRIGALALAVIGVGLLVGAFRRRGWGLLPVTVPLIGFVVVSSLVSGFSNLGDQNIVVSDAAQLQSRYAVNAGNVHLDLSAVAVPDSRTVEVHAGMGRVTVLLPSQGNTTVECTVGLGDTHCSSEGGPPFDPARPVLDVDVHVGLGDVEVHRG